MIILVIMLEVWLIILLGILNNGSSMLIIIIHPIPPITPILHIHMLVPNHLIIVSQDFHRGIIDIAIDHLYLLF